MKEKSVDEPREQKNLFLSTYLPIIIGFIFSGIFGSLINDWIDRSNKQNQAVIEYKIEINRDAKEAISKVSSMFDPRIYRALNVIESYYDEKLTNKRMEYWQRYAETVSEWNYNFSNNSYLIGIYLGYIRMKELGTRDDSEEVTINNLKGDSICQMFSNLHDDLLRIKSDEKQLSIEKYNKFENRISLIRNRFTGFIEECIHDITKNDNEIFNLGK